MKRFALIALIALMMSFANVGSATAAPICVEAGLGKTFPVKNPERGFFFRPVPGTESLVGLSAQDSLALVDFKTGKRYPVPGRMDPVPSPDGRWITAFDLDRNSKRTRIVFYPIQSILDGKPQAALEIPSDSDYQSLGGSGPSNGPPYRMITVKNSGLAMDMIAERNGSLVHEGQRALCPGKDLVMPWVSPDGKLLHAYDVKKKSSVVLNIAGDRCDVVHEFGYMVGKGNFSFDGKKLTFHLSGEGYSVIQTFQANAYVLDLENPRKIRPLTRNSKINSVYPSFTQDGRIVIWEGAPSSLAEEIQFRVVEPDEGGSVLPTALPDCEREASLKGLAGLGALYAAICTSSFKNETSIDPDYGRFIALSLKKKACRQMVESQWNKSVARKVVQKTRRQIEKKELLAACDILSE